MFSFFHRTPTVNLDTFISSSFIYESTPIIPSFKACPQWWLDLPSSLKKNFDHDQIPDQSLGLNPYTVVNNVNSIKNCFGFIEFYKKGAVIENWTDLSVKTGPAGYKYFSSNAEAHEHPATQYGEGFKNYFHMKLMNPWLFSEKTGVKFLLIPATWSLEDYNMVIPPGILDFTITNISHINMFLPKRSDEFLLEIGHPLVHLIPLSEKKLKIKNHLVNQQEHDKIRNQTTISFFGWRKKLELLRRNKKREDIKCPFQ